MLDTAGRERKLSGSGVRQLGQAQRPPHANKPAVLSPGSDMESAFAEALVSGLLLYDYQIISGIS